MAKVRVYGKNTYTWYDEITGHYTQKEYEYREFDTVTGQLVGMGTEDFSSERYKNDVSEFWAWYWTGEYNRGGHRKFEDYGFVKCRKSDRKNFREFLKNKYNTEVIRLNKF